MQNIFLQGHLYGVPSTHWNEWQWAGTWQWNHRQLLPGGRCSDPQVALLHSPYSSRHFSRRASMLAHHLQSNVPAVAVSIPAEDASVPLTAPGWGPPRHSSPPKKKLPKMVTLALA